MNRRLRVAFVLALALGCGAAAAFLWRSGAPFELGEQVHERAHPGDIMMYGATTCGWCKKAARWFAVHDIAYSSCEIDRDAQCRAEWRARRGVGTPLFVVRGRQLTGYDPQAIARALR